MSTHLIPSGVDLEKLERLLDRHLRWQGYQNPDDSRWLVAGKSLLAFEPDLTAQEQTLLADLFALCKSPLECDSTDYAVFKTERPGLAAYLAKSNPTAAEGAAAIKSIIRVLNAIVRTG